MILNINKELILEAIGIDATGREYSKDMPTLKEMDGFNRVVNGALIGAPIGAVAGAGITLGINPDVENPLPGIIGGATAGAIASRAATPSIERGINNITPTSFRSKDDYGDLTLKQRFTGNYS